MGRKFRKIKTELVDAVLWTGDMSAFDGIEWFIDAANRYHVSIAKGWYSAKDILTIYPLSENPHIIGIGNYLVRLSNGRLIEKIPEDFAREYRAETIEEFIERSLF